MKTAVGLLATRIFLSACTVVPFAGSKTLAEEGSAALNLAKIHGDEVTTSNLDAFKKQIQDDLPIGTRIADVEAYLVGNYISFSYVPPIRSASVASNIINMLVHVSGDRLAFPTDLAITVYFNENYMVSDIKFSMAFR